MLLNLMEVGCICDVIFAENTPNEVTSMIRKDIKGVIFDFNGTMFFDREIQEESWRIFLNSKLTRSISNEEFQEYVHGRNIEVTLEHFMQKALSREEIIRLSTEKEAVYRSLCLARPDRFQLADGLPQFLDELKEKGLSFTIATASTLDNVKFFFKYLQLGQWFQIDKVVYNDGSIQGKPSPDIYLRAAHKIHVNIEECAVFEDAKSGIEAAKNAGAGMIIGVASMMEKKELLSYGVASVIKNFIK